MEESSAIINFLGRFHPLVVHLPIGFLTLAILLEIISHRKGSGDYDDVLRIVWLLSAVAAIVAVILGYFLSQEGGYDEGTLSLHQWSGIFLAGLCAGCYLLRKSDLLAKPFMSRLYFALLSLTSALLVVTGHLGGSLTHGDEYLVEYAPASIQRLWGMTPVEAENRREVSSLDSADIFKDAVAPILNSKCISCHNKRKRKGELVLTTYAGIMKGGENGPVITPGSLTSSELYRRITLPEDHKDFMPSEGKRPLTEDQVAIIKWWIEKQAPASGLITSFDPAAEMTLMFMDYFGLNESDEEAIQVPPADSSAVRTLVANGFTIRRLSASSNLLEAKFTGHLTDTAAMRSLLGVKDQLIWLQLSDTGLSDDALVIVSQLTNLRKLNISRNPVSDQGVSQLNKLVNLEYLNLYGTNVTDSILEGLVSLPKLEELYLWQTKVGSDYAEHLSLNKPGLKIVVRTP